MSSIFYGLLSALGWGAADFTGGLASRKTGAFRTVFYGEVIGIVLILALAFGSRESFPPLSACLFALTAGILGTMGLLMLYHSMTLGLMSIATPVSALLAATLPVLIGAFMEGLPNLATLSGFGSALLAVWFISQGADGVKNIFAHIADLKLPLLSGIGFGLYFVIMHEATRHNTYWPMVVSRSGGMTVIAITMFLRREAWNMDKVALPLIALNGFLDVGGNLFYILASQSGRMDVAAMLSSLFPAATVALAALILKERVSPSQWVGIFFALIAIVLMTLPQ